MKKLLILTTTVLAFNLSFAVNFEDHWQIEGPNGYTRISSKPCNLWKNYSEEEANNAIRHIEHYDLPIYIKDDFLNQYRGVNIDLSPMKNVVEIGDDFLSNTNLENIDLSILRNINTIPNYFLTSNNNFTEIDLSPLSKITTIGDGFLSGNDQLIETYNIDFSRLNKIGDYFMSGVGIRHLNTESFGNVHSIGEGFMDFSQLEDIDFSNFKSLDSIGKRFLANSNVQPKNVNLKDLSHVNFIGEYFLGYNILTNKYKSQNNIIMEFMESRKNSN